MTRRLFPLLLFALLAVTGQAQRPEILKNLAPAIQTRSLACPPGVTSFAGTGWQAIRPGSQSNNVRFLEFGDTLDVRHNMNWTHDGDPNPATTPGIGYVFYKSDPNDPPPGIMGPELSQIEADTNLLLNPPPPIDPTFAQFYAYTDDTDNSGTTFFWNDGSLQNFFNGGDPIEIWYAPITIDDYFGSTFEVDGSGTRGGCINVNTDESFSVVYLNVLNIENITPSGAGNGCAAEIVLTGGQPEFDGSNYTIDISLTTDNTVKGEFVSAYSHGDTMKFWVNEAGVYTVTITDDINGSTTLNIDLSGCSTVNMNLPDTSVIEGGVVCVDITAENLTDVTSVELYFQWDNSIITFNSLMSGQMAPPELFFGPPMPNGFMIISWNDFTNTPVSFNDGDVLFQVCFNAVGNPGEISPFDFIYNPPDEDPEIAGANDFFLGFNGTDGSVLIVSNNLTLDFSSCGGRANPAPGNGTFTVGVTGGAAPYNFNWELAGSNPPLTGNGTIAAQDGSATVVDLPPGTYNVTVTDAAMGAQVGTVTIADENPMRVTLFPQNPRCSYTSDGRLTANVFNGTGPYTYSWSFNNQMGVGLDQISGIPANDYTVTVTDALGCAKVAIQPVFKPEIVVATEELIHVSCLGTGDDGSVRVSASGGNGGPYTYAWNIAGQTDSLLTGLTPGDYTVTVADIAMCMDTVVFTVNDADRPFVTSWDSISVQCPNDGTGSLTVNAQSNNSTISSYNWSTPPGGNGPTITGLNGGLYTVTITAADGCEGVDSIFLAAPEGIRFRDLDSLRVVSPSCPGLNDGSITIFPAGGSGNYTYLWEDDINNPSTNNRRSGLVAGIYSVSVYDDSGCNDTLILDNIDLFDPPQITVLFNELRQASCAFGTSDGEVEAVASSGPAGDTTYRYEWSNGFIEDDVRTSTNSTLSAGWNFVTISDDSNCGGIVDSVFVGAPDPLDIDLDSTFSISPSCTGDMDGIATVKGFGGTPAYTYLWDFNNTPGRTLSGLSSGIYNVTITDNNGCTTTTSVEVADPPPLVAAIDSISPGATRDVTCNGDTDGQITANPSGGTPPYNYVWTGGISTSNVALDLAPGTYTVTVTDSKGCTAEVSHEVISPPPLVAVVSPPVEPRCFGDRTAIFIDTVFGGAGRPYTFTVDGGPQQFTDGGAVFVLAGDHVVAVQDSAGCEVVETVNIGQPSPIVVSLGDDIEIQLGETGIIEANIGSNLQIDSLIWTGIDSFTCLTPDCRTIEVGPISTSTLELTVFDINGCTGSDEIIIDVDRNRNVFIPNVFSPNQDGTNDLFQVFLGPGVSNINYIQVYDRWGALQYRAENINPASAPLVGWNGISSNGKEMNVGVYVYLVEVSFIDGKVLLYRGDVTLVR